ncbi:hypothetical protein FACS1894184_06910 [Clostridia bacterium]|nr:hypothetical protein FACS1894184_06910 [Clostridia bacterium]
MSEGMKALRQQLGTVGAEVFVFTIKAEEPFNYTEWRRNSLFEDMTAEELLSASAEYAKAHRPVFKKLYFVPFKYPRLRAPFRRSRWLIPSTDLQSVSCIRLSERRKFAANTGTFERYEV